MLAVAALTAAAAQAADSRGSSRFPFREHVIEPNIPAGYQILAADLNSDGRPDVVGLSGRGEELYWYENPGWRRHTIASGMHRMITLDAADVNGDGRLELALGTHFGQTGKTSEGRLLLLQRRGDPRQPWAVREIDRLPTTHRVRFADLDGDGRPELVNSPLTGPGAESPQFRGETPLVYYQPPEWERRSITRGLDGVVHGMYACDWEGQGREAVLTASFGGIDLFLPRASAPKLEWEHVKLAAGGPSPRPQSGASEIRVGRLPGGGRFLATIEPWHGHQVVVYTEAAGKWKRQVLDDSLSDGHALVIGDFNEDGADEIAAGYRAEGARVLLYHATGPRGRDWRREVVDEAGMSAAGCDAADFNSDGRLDLACIGSRTANIVWYENLGGGRE